MATPPASPRAVEIDIPARRLAIVGTRDGAVTPEHVDPLLAERKAVIARLTAMRVWGKTTGGKLGAKWKEPLYDPRELEIDLDYFCKKLRITRSAFDAFVEAPPHHHTDFPTWEGRYRLLKRAQGLVERISGKRVNVYS